MSDSEQTSNGGYFIDDASATAFNIAFTRMLAKLQKEAMSQFISPGNTHRFRHGGDWNNPGAPEAIGGEMQTYSAVAETRFQDLIDNDLNAIDRSARHLIESMQRHFTQMVYSTVGAACDRTGNIVDAKIEGSLEAAFMAMIEKIHFSADKDGKVNLPEVHVAPDLGARMIATLDAASPEYKERLETLKERKIKEALEREVERKAKFVRYGADT